MCELDGLYPSPSPRSKLHDIELITLYRGYICPLLECSDVIWHSEKKKPLRIVQSNKGNVFPDLYFGPLAGYTLNFRGQSFLKKMRTNLLKVLVMLSVMVTHPKKMKYQCYLCHQWHLLDIYMQPHLIM